MLLKSRTETTAPYHVMYIWEVVIFINFLPFNQMFQLLCIDLQPTWLQQPFQISSCALISASWWSCDCWSSEHDMKLLQLQLSWQYCYIYTRTQHCINPSLIPYWLNHDTSCDHVNHFDRSSCTFQIKPILVFLHVISIYSVYTVDKEPNQIINQQT